MHVGIFHELRSLGIPHFDVASKPIWRKFHARLGESIKMGVTQLVRRETHMVILEIHRTSASCVGKLERPEEIHSVDRLYF